MISTVLHQSRLVLFVAYAICCWVFFQPMLLELHGHWVRPNDLDAGYLLLLVTCMMFWQGSADQSTGRSGWVLTSFGSIAFVLCLTAAALATITATKSLALGLLVGAFVPLALAVLGKNALGATLQGSALLSLATPAWFVLIPALQALTAVGVNWLLQRGRWPVYVEDNFIFLPEGTLEIAAGCAGLKFVQSALALVLIEGFFNRRNWRAILLIACVATLLAMFCNWLRIAVITLMAFYLDINHPWVFDHNWVGWLVFGVLFGPLFFWLGGKELFAQPAQALANHTTAKASQSSVLVVFLACLATGFGVSSWIQQLVAGKESSAIGELQLAALKAHCLPATAGAHPAPANFPGATLTLDCALGQGRYLSVRGYLQERQESEIINEVNQLVPGLGQLDFSVANAWSKAQALSDDGAPGTFHGPQLSLAYSYYAARRFSPTPSVFKLRSLTRPLYPGPVWALVLTAPAKDPGLIAAFSEIQSSLTRAQVPTSP